MFVIPTLHPAKGEAPQLRGRGKVGIHTPVIPAEAGIQKDAKISLWMKNNILCIFWPVKKMARFMSV